MNKKKRVAYLIMEDQGNFVIDYYLSFEPMTHLGWEVEEVAWRSGPDWNDFDAVYVCTPWDYPEHADEFIAVLEAINASKAVLCNPLSTIRWNLEKTYMRDIAARGDDIVPSTWYEDFNGSDVPRYFKEHGVDRVVIKPIIGGNAKDTFVLERPVDEDRLRKLAGTFSGRPFFVQPFIENIQSEGEFSLFFFNGEYSHAILKSPKAGDFRVQEEHGADITSVLPPTELLVIAHTVFAHIDPLPVYGRGDWVRGPDGRFLLMELELIEPSLYLRTDSAASSRFARAFDQWFEELARE